MIGRRTLVAASLTALLLLGVSAGFILAQTPPRVWPWVLAHNPRVVVPYLAYWLSPPLGFASVLLALLTTAWFRRGKPVPPGDRRWVGGALIGFGLVSTMIEVVHIAGLLAARAQRAAYLAGGGAPHAFHFDPTFVITRIGMASAGLFIVWLGNRLPKLMTGLTDRAASRRAWSVVRRLGGWLFVLAGLGMFACAFVTPVQRATAINLAIAACSLLIWIVAWAACRFGGAPSTTAPSS